MRDDFSQKVKDMLADRVGHQCSRPDCRASTIGPGSEDFKVVNLGVAAHITAASVRGPRYDSTLSAEDRKAAANGIWLCQGCAKYIDSDITKFSSSVLREWKRQAENAASEALGKTRHNESTLGQMGRLLDQKLSPVLAHLQLSTGPAQDDLDVELDDVKKELDTNNVPFARRLVEKFIERRSARWTSRQQWRAKTLLAATFVAVGEFEKAGHLLIDSSAMEPAEEKARVNEASGHEMLGQRTRAHELATVLRRELPESAGALAVWIRTSPDTTTAEEMEREAGSLATTHVDVALSIAATLLFRRQHAVAEKFARAATSLDSDSPQGWFLYGQVTHQHGFLETRSDVKVALLSEADGYYSKAIERAVAEGPPNLLSSAYVNRAIVRELLGRLEDADSDFRKACELFPDDTDNAGRFSVFLFLRERYEPCVPLAEQAAKADPTGRFTYLLASALFKRNHAGDQERGIEVWKAMIRDGGGDYYDAAVWSVIRAYSMIGQLHNARTVLASVPPERITEVARHTHESRLLLEAGDIDRAVDVCRAALAVADSETGLFNRMNLAFLSHQLNLHSETISLLASELKAGVLDDAMNLTLVSAIKSESHGLFLRLCSQLREAGADYERFLQMEIEFLSQYDPRLAADRVLEYLRKHPDDPLAQLRLSLLGRQCEERQWINTDVERLPQPADALPATIGWAVIQLLVQEGRAVEALRFAYEQLRAYPNDPSAHFAYISLFFTCDTNGWPVNSPRHVETDAAVCYRDIESETDYWIVIEANQPNETMGEFAPDHARVSRMIGLKRGEEFIQSSGVIERRGKVVAILTKYIYRFERARDNYQVNFPDQNDLQAVKVIHRNPDGTERVDLAPIFANLDRWSENARDVLSQYRAHPLPIHALSCLLGRNLFETMDCLSWPGLGIRCWNGADSEWNEAVGVFRNPQKIVLELTALFSLWRLEVLEQLARAGKGRFVVTQRAFDRLRNLAFVNPVLRSNGNFVALGQGRYTWVEFDQSQRQRYHDSLNTLVDWVRTHCEIAGCLEIADLSAERRESMIQAFGRDGVEAMGIATRADHVLWTDDLTLASVTSEHYPGIRRTWTQPALYSMVEVGLFEHEAYVTATVRLLALRHERLRFDVQTLLRAGQLSGWSSEVVPFRQGLELFGRVGIAPATRVQLAAEFIPRMFEAVESSLIRGSIIRTILNQLADRQAITALSQRLNRTFRWDGAGLLEARGYISAWQGSLLWLPSWPRD